MKGHIQRIEYEGYLAADAELKYFPSGDAVLNFRIGSTRKYNDKAGEEVKETTWMNCSITRTKWAEALAAQKLEKGSHVIVFGRLRVNQYGAPRTYQRQNGEWVGTFDVTVDDMQILRWGSGNGSSTSDETYEPQGGELPY